jgi:hypothetical protein
MQEDPSLERFVQAARPTLFDVACHPELLIALTFANFMSPALWKLRGRIYERLANDKAPALHSHGEAVMSEIHDYVNRKFYCVPPTEAPRLWGTLDLDEERARLGAAGVNYALNVIVSGLRKIQQLEGRPGSEELFQLIESGRFPDYHYAILDIVEAHSQADHTMKHRPLRVSSCADEAALMAALAFTEPPVGPDDVVLLGSPLHYTTFVKHQDECFWFNGKKEFHTARTWAGQTRGHGDAQGAFDDRVAPFDRIIAPSGCHFFATNESTIPGKNLSRIGDCLGNFFGIELRQIREARERGIVFKDNSQLFDPLTNLAQARNDQDAAQMIREAAERHPGSEYELALYAFRSIHVRRPEVYLHAALRGRRARELAAKAQTVADAIQLTLQVPGNESVLHSTGRLALPGEVLLFGTGNHRDKALLLYALIRHAPQLPSALKQEARVVFTKTASYVRVDGHLINTATFAPEDDVSEVMIEMG